MKIKKILPKALAVAILTSTLASTSFASGSVNTNSGFYRSRRTRQAYMNLTADQRREIDAINTNNNTQITIKEVKAHGKYKLPIVRGQNYLYAFMDDRNNNGMVGENETEASESSSGTENNDQENNQEAPEEVTDEEIENLEEVEEENLEEDLDSNQEIQEDPSSNEEKEEEPVENQIPNDYLDRLEASLKNAKTTIAGAEILVKNMPKFSTQNGEIINNLIEKQNQIIARAEKILLANGREIVID
ncbi:hypothetical protein AB9Q04_02495 [Anaerococcus sp. ENR1011]|uniref:Uncharacterized protein n=1 Tax=Anaerococcus groningensis TaxID=3115616 RepID=A0ABW9MZE9_9FIRM